MESVSPNDFRIPDRIEPGQGVGPFPCLDIEFNESAGSVRVYDPRLFQAGRRGFCERLLVAATRQPGIIKAEVDLTSASCQVEFSPGSQTPECMADSFVSAVGAASAGCWIIDRMCWWRRRGRWSALTAFPLPDGVSVWETFALFSVLGLLISKRSWSMILAPNIACIAGVFTLGFGIMASVVTNNVAALAALANGVLPLRKVAQIEAERRHRLEMSQTLARERIDLPAPSGSADRRADQHGHPHRARAS